MTARSALLKNLDRPVGVDNGDSSHDFDSGIEKGIGYPFLSRVLKKSNDHVFSPPLAKISVDFGFQSKELATDTGARG